VARGGGANTEKPGEENLRSLTVAVLRALEEGHGFALLVNDVVNGGGNRIARPEISRAAVTCPAAAAGFVKQ
jgi:hypothetical protein